MPQSKSHNIYVTGTESGSGKSLVVLAIMDALSSQADNIGFFRPVVSGTEQRDGLINLISTRYRLDLPDAAMYGCSKEHARTLVAENRYDDLLKEVLKKYRELQGRCDYILCAGTDYAYSNSALEFDFNADVANNLGCTMIPVVRGSGRANTEIADATMSFLISLQERDCDILGTVINAVANDQLDGLRELLQKGSNAKGPFYLVPQVPSLRHPTVGDIAIGLDSDVLYGQPASLNRQVQTYKVAAMQIPDFLDHLEADSFVIAPGDRSDIVLACLMSYPSTAYPQISGLLLTGNLQPAGQLTRLIDGIGSPPFAILSTDADTFSTAMKVNDVQAELSPENDRKIAAALGVVEASVDMEDIRQRLIAQKSTRVTPLMFEYELLHLAQQRRKHIVLPEGSDERILRAAEILMLRDIVDLTLLGDAERIKKRIQELGLALDGVRLIDPRKSDLRNSFAQHYYGLRRHKGISEAAARDTITDVSYFGTMMVHLGHADGMVSGAVHTTQHTIRPSFEIIKTRPGTSIVSSVFLMCLEDRVLVYGDCAVNPDPDAAQLADIAASSADTAALFGITPRVAMLSYSTGESGKGAAVDKVREATKILRMLRPDLSVEGPIQYDAAVDVGVAKTKLPDSEVAGSATVFVFPDLNTGNNTYKAVQRSADAVAIGPVLQGLNKPVNDLSRGCTVTDIVNTVAITAVQAQSIGAEP